MLKLSTIVGNAADPDLGHRLHHLAEREGGLVEYLTLAPEDTARKRMRLHTDRGTEVAVILGRNERLVDGAVLLLERGRAVVVRLSTPRWIGLAPRDPAAALELGYFAGNMHWKVRFQRASTSAGGGVAGQPVNGPVLWIRLEGDPAAYRARLADFFGDGRAMEVAGQAPAEAAEQAAVA